MVTATADIKKFTGFTTADGKTFATLKEATQHITDTKTMGALVDLAAGVFSGAQGLREMGTVETREDELAKIGFSYDEEYRRVMIDSATGLAQFLFAYRKTILAAFKQEVRMRAEKSTPRKPRSDKGTKVSLPPATDATDPALRSTTRMATVKQPATDGVGFIEEDDSTMSASLG